MKESNITMPIILFDGVCNFCNRTVNIIIKHDKEAHFKFAASQSIGGIKLLQQFKLDQKASASVILIDNETIYTKTDAVIQIAKYLKGWPRLLMGLKLIPKPLRDFGYDTIAKNRYTLFGKRATCRTPEASERNRFLD
ncbi:MAG: thiol-disulfide oxidoreductase DCC family protein [Chitinophagia bacterium]